MPQSHQVVHDLQDHTKFSHGLTKIIGGLSNFFDKNAQNNITEGIICELSRMLELDIDQTFIVKRGILSDQRENTIRFLGASGKNTHLVNHSIQRLADTALIERLNKAFANEQDILGDDYSVIFTSYQYFHMALYIPMRVVLGSAEYTYLKDIIDGVTWAQLNADKLNELYSHAYLDALTQLPNRHDFIRMLNQPDYTSSPFGLTVALVDIQHFSDVNDALGQDVGNALLKAIAKRLCARCDETCKVARVGADIFGLIGSSATLSAKFIDNIFDTPFRAANNTLNVNVAIGLCILEGEVDNGIDILKRCNMALNEAKRSFPNKAVWYNQELESATVWRLELTRRLSTAYDLKELELWYQPKFTLEDRKVYGFEALLRWRQKDGSFITPDTFIPLAEYSGIIVELGKWVLDEAMRTLASFKNQKIQMAVNVSMIQLRQRSFVHDLKCLIEKHDIDPALLEIEITESVLMKETDYTIKTLEQLKALGLSIAIDDFGTGFSSLQYLQRMPIDRLKIDREFVKNSHNPKTKIVTEMIVQLAQKFGMHIVAEGIEQQEQLELLLELGCTEGQGFALGYPMQRYELSSLAI